MRKRIILIHPELGGCGGSEAVCLWTIEALKDEYDISLITLTHIDIGRLNTFYGTSLEPHEFSVIVVHPFIKALIDRLKFSRLKQHSMIRYHKHTLSRLKYDLVISTANELDFGCKGIQYVHFPWCNEKVLRDLNEMPSDKWRYQDTFFRKAYLRLCRLISSWSEEGMRQNITLANSNWTGEVVRKAYGIESCTVYPPVPTDFPRVHWDKREGGFVCIGRLTPAKRIETIIEILKQVRGKGWDIHLHIAGDLAGNDQQYVARIRQMCVSNSSWIFLEGNLPRNDLVNLVSKHKFGIHGMEYEHFGIVVAEMVKAGCIVFVPHGGGQVEIVNESQLLYQSLENAVERIIAVLSSDILQTSLREKLSLNADRFSVESFSENMRQIVNDFFKSTHTKRNHGNSQR